MARELNELMREAAAADEAVLAHVVTDGALARAVVGVRRRRRVRHAQQVVLGAAAVAAVGAVVVLGAATLRHPAPAESPSPSPSHEVTSSPSPSVSAPSATAAALVVEPGLPPYRPLTADVLASAGPGWVVVDYTPTVGAAKDLVHLLVVAPDGAVYRAADPQIGDQLGEPGIAFAVERWVAGSPSVVVSVGEGDSPVRARLDLLSGEVVPEGRGLPQASELVGIAPDGSEVWAGAYDEGVWLLAADGDARKVADATALGWGTDSGGDPSGRYLAVTVDGNDTRVLDLATEVLGPPVTTQGTYPACWFGGWADPGRLVMLCSAVGPAEPADAVVVVDVSGPSPVQVSAHQYASDELRPSAGLAWAGHGRLLADRPTTPGAGDMGVGCMLRPSWFDAEGRATTGLDGGAADLAGPVRATSVDGTVYVGEQGDCAVDNGGGNRLISIDPAGVATVLVPRLPTEEAGRFSWVVAR
ncbi:hypothetical protein Cch01nite_17140 [Cellulomonas chitinilytica]|uniref:Uncharacterized protein n=1 Tax=Cellulomonas chitinilytica TaxID=398759 RepID=A0A919TYU7_9CELL|nr:hypothetical protein [Cellulomonas chitinilytica]GIG20990.1 hypothetical protein Cch01nite_17140 [Cellulomonas chitinilytica]